MRVKLLHVAIAGALLTTAGVAQAAGAGGPDPSTSGQRLLCGEPLSQQRGQNSCVLYTPGSPPQRVTVAPGTAEQGVMIRPDPGGAPVTPPSASVPSSAPSESTPGKMVYFVQPIASERVVRELVVTGDPKTHRPPDARNDAFPDPSPGAASPMPREDWRAYELRQGGPTGPERPQGPRQFQ
jgi:hypothetical protein